MDRTELEKIYKKHINGYLERNRMVRFEDIPTRIFIDAMEEALSIANVVGQNEHLPQSSSYEPCEGCDLSCPNWMPFFCDKK